MLRRQLLASTALIPVAMLLAGCPSAGTQVPLFVSAIKAIGQQALLSLPQLQAAGLSGASAAKAQTIVDQIEKIAGAISDAATATDGQSTLIKIEGYINALAPIVATFASLIPGGAVIGLVVAALPAIEFAVNMTVSLLTPTAKAIASSAPIVPAGPSGAVNSAAPPEVIAATPYLNELLHRAGMK